MIELKNIDLRKVESKEQLSKLNEEHIEFIESIIDHSCEKEISNEHMIEEFWDMVQAGLGLLHLEGVNAKEVMEGYSEHLEKIKNRPR